MQRTLLFIAIRYALLRDYWLEFRD